MEQLLQITTIPITYELKVHNARLEMRNSTAEIEISRDEGGMKIRSRPIQLKMDTFEARNSVCPTTARSIRQFADAGKSAAYEATASWAQEGKLLLNANIGSDTLSQVFTQHYDRLQPTGEFQLSFTPKTGPNISWTPPDITIEYQMDKLNFDLKVSNGNVEFIPGDIELNITQMPDVKIEYIGQPIYVPPSAAEYFNHTVDILA